MLSPKKQVLNLYQLRNHPTWDIETLVKEVEVMLHSTIKHHLLKTTRHSTKASEFTENPMGKKKTHLIKIS